MVLATVSPSHSPKQVEMMTPMDTTRLCTMMDELARLTWNDVVQAREWGLHRGEVTITETLLLALKTYERQASLGFDLNIVPTSQATERRSGADFEIWLQIGQHRYFPYSIQAKKAKVSAPKGSYDTLRHPGHPLTPVGPKARKGAPFQYDTLIAHAAKNHTIPVHLFYNGWKAAPAGVGFNNPSDQEIYGCAILSTWRVKEIREAGPRNVNQIKAYAPEQRPWSALFRTPPKGRPGPGPLGGGLGPALGTPLDTENRADLSAVRATFELDTTDQPEIMFPDLTRLPSYPERLPSYVSDAIRVSEEGQESEEGSEDLPDDPALPRFAVIIRDPR